MAPELKILAALAKKQVWFPAHMLGGSQPPVTPVPEDESPSSGLCVCVHTCITHIHAHIKHN